MPNNYYMYFVAALIPMIIGFIYYHPKVAGSAWMKVNKFTPADLEGGNMGVIFGVSYVFSILLAFALTSIVIHQGGAIGMMYPDVFEPGNPAQDQFNQLMEQWGNNSRTFGHGALHGGMAGLFIALPILGTNALFEKKGSKYILINVCYWIITLALMGGLLCATLEWSPL